MKGRKTSCHNGASEPHVAPLDKTRLCHLPCWHPCPPVHPPLSRPQPSVPYKHTKLSVSGSSCRQRQFCVTSARSPAPDDNQGPQGVRDITNPQVQRAKQLAPTEEDLSHVSWDSNHSKLMVILDGAQRHTEGRVC